MEELVSKHQGLRPAQLVDLQALAGDAVDNLSGVRGIGGTIARALVKHFGDVEGLARSLHLDELHSLAVLDDHPLYSTSIPTVTVEVTEEAVIVQDIASSVSTSVGATTISTTTSTSTSTAKHKKVSATSVKLSLDQVAAVIGEERAQHILEQTKDALAQSNVSTSRAMTVLSQLLLCGAKRLRLFRELVKLKRDLEIPDLESSQCLRYRGEVHSASGSRDWLVEEVCEELRAPLQLLRQQYHHLDRHD
jgi:5'-3' exonuclease